MSRLDRHVNDIANIVHEWLDLGGSCLNCPVHKYHPDCVDDGRYNCGESFYRWAICADDTAEEAVLRRALEKFNVDKEDTKDWLPNGTQIEVRKNNAYKGGDAYELYTSFDFIGEFLVREHRFSATTFEDVFERAGITRDRMERIVKDVFGAE